MKRVFCIPSLVVIALLVPSRPAQAGIIDWLEQLSGPGPYSTKTFLAATVCPTKHSLNGRTYSPDNWFPCYYVDNHRFHSVKDDNFPATKANLVDFGVAFEVRRQIEVGAGAGWIDFSTKAKSTAKFTVTLARVTVAPLQFGNWSRTRWYARIPDMVKLYARETWIPGEITAADLGVTSTFRAEDDKITSMGVVLDLGELLPRR